MADATQADLIRQVLEDLSVLAGGQTVAAEDAALVATRIVSVNEELRELGICYWSDDAFPQSIKNALATYVACACAGPLYPGAPEYALSFSKLNKPQALADLYRITATSERVYQPSRALYF